jgi:small subunit ribosomal protein S17
MERTQMADEAKQQRATKTIIRRTGIVRSTGGHKTIRVDIESMVKHPMYGKYMRRRTRLAAHDPENTAQVGDTVEITPCRRLSKSKSWRLVRIIRRGQAPAPAAVAVATGSEV